VPSEVIASVAILKYALKSFFKTCPEVLLMVDMGPEAERSDAPGLKIVPETELLCATGPLALLELREPLLSTAVGLLPVLEHLEGEESSTEASSPLVSGLGDVAWAFWRLANHGAKAKAAAVVFEEVTR
jgi:hypothetical protein